MFLIFIFIHANKKKKNKRRKKNLFDGGLYYEITFLPFSFVGVINFLLYIIIKKTWA